MTGAVASHTLDPLVQPREQELVRAIVHELIMLRYWP
jgi:hypothetical protein